tara:strand:+ start:200 stop:1417 length:1218 start_codon:yes stop_codon:yes gene_type:complete
MIRIFLILLAAGWLGACIHIQPVKSIEEAEVYSSRKGHIVDVTPYMLKKLLAGKNNLKKTFVVEYSADWCKACQAMKPTLAKLAGKYKDKLTVGIYNISSHPDEIEIKQPSVLPKFAYFVPGHTVRFSTGAHRKAIKKVFADLPNLPEKFSLAKPDNDLKSYFFIGGATDITNFGKEAIYHLALMREKGIKHGSTGCYFNQPDFFQYYLDNADYNFLKDRASRCYPAEKRVILRDLNRAIKTVQGEIYIYITSHGDPPKKNIENCPVVGKPRVLLGTPEGCSEENYLTAQDLANALGRKKIGTKIYLVIQACYSGSFIDPLKDISGLTILTASRDDRTSFGCDSGESFTYFGGTYLKVIAGEKKYPRNWNWQKIHQDVSGQVDVLETRNRIPMKERSLPQLHLGK